ncbi:MAG: RNA methyltransferase [Anaerolineae bacterium]|nr:RNA methyltransferase [Anaerolineae bacterium]
MADDITITSTRNPRVVAARKLTQRKHRARQGRFLVQGQQLLWMALDAGYMIEEVFTSSCTAPEQDDTRELLHRMHKNGTQLIQVSSEILKSLTSRDDMQTLVGTVKQKLLSLHEIILPKIALVLILDRLQDCGNTGTLIRTADAAGASVVILLEPCADVTDPRAVRSSMGSLFNLPVVSVPDISELRAWLKAHKLPLIAADAHQGTLWGNHNLHGPAALCLGNEARGLSADLAALVDSRVRLPMLGKADSLNVAVAGGILMYLWVKVNHAPQPVYEIKSGVR